MFRSRSYSYDWEPNDWKLMLLLSKKTLLKTPSASGSSVPPLPILTYCLLSCFQLVFSRLLFPLFLSFPVNSPFLVGPGYFSFMFLIAFEDNERSFSSFTNSREDENNGFRRVTMDIVVGPDGLTIANIPSSGKGGIVALGIANKGCLWRGQRKLCHPNMVNFI